MQRGRKKRLYPWSIVVPNTARFLSLGMRRKSSTTPRGSSWPVCSKGSYSPDYRHNLAITESGSGNRSGYDFKAGEWWNAPNRARDSFENPCIDYFRKIFRGGQLLGVHIKWRIKIYSWFWSFWSRVRITTRLLQYFFLFIHVDFFRNFNSK